MSDPIVRQLAAASFRREREQRWCGNRCEVDGHYLPCAELEGHEGPCAPNRGLLWPHLRHSDRTACERAQCPRRRFR